MEKKDLYLKIAMKQIPRILTLADRDVSSPTYGCFDREYWHYGTADFPCGMSQEFVLPLALVYKHEFRENPYYKQETVKDLVIAGIGFAEKSSHRDGSCDDYFPFERAYGATAFSLYAFAESCRLLGIKENKTLDFLEKRGKWLSSHSESGKLTNHHAIAGLALLVLWQLTGKKHYRKTALEKINLCLSWQSGEGWFSEYEGCDPGYLTMTIDFLARAYSITKGNSLLESLKKALEFLECFVYPDGTCGGELGSRDTYLFMPHGFELLAKECPKAVEIKTRYLKALENGLATNYEDNRIFGHMTYSHLLSWLDYCGLRGDSGHRQFRKSFPEAGLYVEKKGRYFFAVSAPKGGVFKVFRDEKLIHADSGFLCEFSDGKISVSNRVSARAHSGSDPCHIKGIFYYYKRRFMSPAKQVVFRLTLIVLGPFPCISKAFRKVLQKILITGKKEAPLSFERRFSLEEDGLVVTDLLLLTGGKTVNRLYSTTDKVSVYIAMAECFNRNMLMKWRQFAEDEVKDLNKARKLEITRRFE
ncbi:MAG: hypothetical protein JW728_04185 [Candidatus Aureabacteria bacterium]|nr:hypothetical protein [Candidatus Auribacterota bacterium]